MAPLERLGAGAVRDTIRSYRDAVRAHAEALNRLNVYPVPDGDTGTNMARTLDAVVAEMDDAPGELGPTCQAIAHGSLMGARGNSGVILSQILRALTTTFERAGAGAAGEVDPSALAAALGSAATAAYQAVLRPVEGTILTVVREAAAAADRAARAGATLGEVLGAARDRAQEALDHTPDLLPVLKEAGVVDAGGAGFLLLLDAALHVVDGRPVPEADAGDGLTPGRVEVMPRHGVEAGDRSGASGPRYEVMYFVDLGDERIGEVKQAWGRVGDSIVVVGGEGLWNCHVHTDDIGAVIEAALDAGGRPSRIRVTDLWDEVAAGHDGVHALREEAMRRPTDSTGAAVPSVVAVTCAAVAVASGDGLIELLGRLGVHSVVTGGQTMNPSTAELLAAVERAPAEQVVLLPNNKNIVAVARQVDALTAKSVRVVVSCSVPEGLAALVAFDPELDAVENAQQMTEAMAGVAVGEVTSAVRAGAGPSGPIVAGDWIGLVQGRGIVAVASVLADAATALLDVLVADDHELVTVIEGSQATPAASKAIGRWLAERRPGLVIETHFGGQPLYPYLFGAE